MKFRVKKKLLEVPNETDWCFNDDVTVMGDISDGYGLRSTSVGDQMLVGNKKYVVASFGFETLEGEPV